MSNAETAAAPAAAATSAPTTGFWSGIASWIKNEESTIWGDVKEEVQAIEPVAIAALDALFSQLMPFAATAAGDIASAVKSGAILNTEARSTLVTQLGEKAQTLGYSLEQQGVTSGLNLIAEAGVGIYKLVTGQSVGAPASVTQPASPPASAA